MHVALAFEGAVRLGQGLPDLLGRQLVSAHGVHPSDQLLDDGHDAVGEADDVLLECGRRPRHGQGPCGTTRQHDQHEDEQRQEDERQDDAERHPALLPA